MNVPSDEKNLIHGGGRKELRSWSIVSILDFQQLMDYQLWTRSRVAGKTIQEASQIQAV